VKPPWEPHSLQRLSTLGGSENTNPNPKLKAKERIAKKVWLSILVIIATSVGKKRK
jgi:hypothetical protein